MEDEKQNPTYSYDVTKLDDMGINQMRLELGDTAVEKGRYSCALCDEEYQAIIKCANSWKKAKYRCVCAIVARLSYQVDYSAGGMSFSLSQRLEEWKRIKDSLERSFQTPSASFIQNGKAVSGQHYFCLGMHDNPNHNKGDC